MNYIPEFGSRIERMKRWRLTGISKEILIFSPGAPRVLVLELLYRGLFCLIYVVVCCCSLFMFKYLCWVDFSHFQENANYPEDGSRELKENFGIRYIPTSNSTLETI